MDLLAEKKPNLFIVGAPKAGTTSLYHYLKQHPDIFFPELKEPNYFSYQYIKAQNLYYQTQNARNDAEYAALYKVVDNQKAIGDASVSYLFYKAVAQKIYEFNADATIVILLRDPVQRAYSHYLMDYSFGYIDIDFEEVVFKKTKHKHAHLYYQQYIELGYYKEQVERYLRLFGPRVKIYLTEELKQNKYHILSDICRTVGVSEIDFSKISINANSFKRARFPLARKLYGNHKLKSMIKQLTASKFNTAIKSMFFETGAVKPQMKEETREYLKELYKPHVLDTGKLLERNLDDWYH